MRTPIVVKFCVTVPLLTLLRIWNFRENLWKEGRTIRMGVNEMTLMRVACNRVVSGK